MQSGHEAQPKDTPLATSPVRKIFSTLAINFGNLTTKPGLNLKTSRNRHLGFAPSGAKPSSHKPTEVLLTSRSAAARAAPRRKSEVAARPRTASRIAELCDLPCAQSSR
eukprot:3173881-Pleurochrysis_carterae.AAC.1